MVVVVCVREGVDLEGCGGMYRRLDGGCICCQLVCEGVNREGGQLQRQLQRPPTTTHCCTQAPPHPPHIPPTCFPCHTRQDIETFLEPIFALFKQQRQGKESLGDFVSRVGFDALREAQAQAGAVAAK